MRLWSLHPTYLDAQGLVAVWREGLLAQAVLRGRTDGYLRHPQLRRFSERAAPVGLIAEYLRGVRAEASRRGYEFAAGRISRIRAHERMTVSREQLRFEWRHLLRKLEKRDPERRAKLAAVKRPRTHPLFRVVRGGVADWEKGQRMKTTTAKNIDSYIADFPSPVRKLLHTMRATIRKAAPEAAEKISYRIPTFTLGGNLVHFAAFKQHIGFFPGSSGIRAFKQQLSAFKGAKGSVQFPFDKPLPLGVIGKIVRFRVKENLQKAEAKRNKKKRTSRRRSKE